MIWFNCQQVGLVTDEHDGNRARSVLVYLFEPTNDRFKRQPLRQIKNDNHCVHLLEVLLAHRNEALLASRIPHFYIALVLVLENRVIETNKVDTQGADVLLFKLSGVVLTNELGFTDSPISD